MIDLTEEYIKSTAYNESSFSNAKKIVIKKQILDTYITKDENLIYGQCFGSGKESYKVSVDFINAQIPVFRCSCPSRQIPCKHCTALLYQYFVDKSTFNEGEIPEDIISKREKIEKKEESKLKEDLKPKKINISAFIKKMKLQLEGIELVEKFIQECLTIGFASIPVSQLKIYKKDFVSQLGNYYIPEHLSRVNDILDNLEKQKKIDSENNSEKSYEYYNKILNNLAILYELSEKSKIMLNKCIDEKRTIDKDNANIFTKMGYVWKIEELKNLQYYKSNAELLQLGFYCYEDDIRKNYVDTGFFIDLNDGRIYKTMNIRPYKISDRLKQDESIFEVITTSEFYIYPGELNPRIKWEGNTTRKITRQDLENVRNKANKDFKFVLKEVKNQLKNTLSDKNPIFLLYYKELILLGDDFAIKDINDEIILLEDNNDMPSTIVTLKFMLKKEDTKDNVILGIFNHDLLNNKLTLKPISVITENNIIRFLG